MRTENTSLFSGNPSGCGFVSDVFIICSYSVDNFSDAVLDWIKRLLKAATAQSHCSTQFGSTAMMLQDKCYSLVIHLIHRIRAGPLTTVGTAKRLAQRRESHPPIPFAPSRSRVIPFRRIYGRYRPDHAQREIHPRRVRPALSPGQFGRIEIPRFSHRIRHQPASLGCGGTAVGAATPNCRSGGLHLECCSNHLTHCL